MSIYFKIVPHLVLPNAEMVEVWNDEKLVGAIYAGKASIRVVSKNISLVLKEDGAPETWRVMFSERIA